METLTKRCTKCLHDKSRDEFYPNRGDCKQCKRQHSHEHKLAERILNPAKIQAEYLTTGEKICKCCLYKKPSQDFQALPIRVRRDGSTVRYLNPYCFVCSNKIAREKWHAIPPEWRKAKSQKRDKTKSHEKYKRYMQENRERHNARVRIRNKLKAKTDIGYRMRLNLSRRIREALKSQKTLKTLDLLGCSIAHFRSHLESKFMMGMTWDNYGSWKFGQPMKWHIDHVKPCASFDLTDPEQQKICFHWSNLQPLWALDNIRKGAKS